MAKSAKSTEVVMVNLKPEDIINRAELLSNAVEQIAEYERRRRAVTNECNEQIKKLKVTCSELATVIRTRQEPESAQLPMFTEVPSTDELLRRGLAAVPDEVAP